MNEHLETARAMQAVPDGAGWTYQTRAGKWHISRDLAMGTVYCFQHDDAETGCPSYMHGTAASIADAMDEIDALVDEDCCTDCDCMFDELIDLPNSKSDFLCHDCLEMRAKRDAEMREMAECDAAEAERDWRAGL